MGLNSADAAPGVKRILLGRPGRGAGQNSPDALIVRPFGLAFVWAHIYEGSTFVSFVSFCLEAFDQARSLQTVNLYGRANGKVAQLISFLEKCVHLSGVHQGNEESEEFCLALAEACKNARPTEQSELYGILAQALLPLWPDSLIRRPEEGLVHHPKPSSVSTV